MSCSQPPKMFEEVLVRCLAGLSWFSGGRRWCRLRVRRKNSDRSGKGDALIRSKVGEVLATNGAVDRSPAGRGRGAIA